MKINGIKLVRKDGTVDINATLNAWDDRELTRVEENRKAFRSELDLYIETAGKWDEKFTETLADFWANPSFSKQVKISKSTIVTMCVGAMVQNGDIKITEVQNMTEMFLGYLDSNIGDEDGDAWMCQGKGRAGQVWQNPFRRQD